MEIIIAVVITFIVTVLWQKYADRKNKTYLRIVIKGLYDEMESMAQDTGYSNLVDYWEKEKTVEYGQNVYTNVQNALKSLE